MSKEYFTENISEATIANMIDKALKFEKSENDRNMKKTLLKMIPVAAAIVLVVGLINIIVPFLDASIDTAGPDNIAESSEEAYSPNINRSNLFLPEKIEKSFFEDRILAAVTDRKSQEKLTIYYFLKDTVYVLDPNISKWEKAKLLDYIYEYTDITLNDLVQMCISIDYVPMELDERYMNVRFGDDHNTLLLDVEWHTYDTFLHEVVEPYKQEIIEWREEDWYINSTDEEKEKRESVWEYWINNYEKELEIINDKFYAVRKVNGKFNEWGSWFSFGSEEYPVDRSEYLDSNGYYIFKIFPVWADDVGYRDENGEWQYKSFYTGRDVCNNRLPCYTQEQYDDLLENQVIPFCDDLLARGLITQEYYDKCTTPTNWLEYYIDLYF